jgi:dienelactone hydrolase
MTLVHDVRLPLGPAPARLVWLGDDPAAAGRRGALLFLHGFGVDIGIQTTELHTLAAAGYLAVGLDAVGHGARRWLDWDERFTDAPLPRRQTMFAVIRDTADEVPAVLDHLLHDGLATVDRVGIGGISMGGYVAYRARVVDDRLSLVLPILASPTWDALEALSPDRFADRFYPATLLSQTAADDEAVDAGQAARFAERLRPLYAASPASLAHIEHPGERHHMSEAGWQRVWGNVLSRLAHAWPVR